MTISIGSDHRGYALKQVVIAALQDKGYEVIDHGSYTLEKVDFPDVARDVCATVKSGETQRGLMLCGSGVGAAIACNKVPGIRACCIHDAYSAHQCVEHDDVNVGCIGADVVGQYVAMELIELFLKAEFSTDPDVRRRVMKLGQMDGSVAGEH